MLFRFISNSFPKTYEKTIQPEFQSKILTLEQTKEVNIQLFDTPSYGTFDLQSTKIYRNAHCCVLVCDRTDKDSLKVAEAARKEFIELGKYKNFPTVLLCNKNDLQGDNKITDQELNSYCKSISLFNVTASNGDGIAKAFETVARMGMKKCSEDDFE